jgi:hypothetical protein
MFSEHVHTWYTCMVTTCEDCLFVISIDTTNIRYNFCFFHQQLVTQSFL